MTNIELMREVIATMDAYTRGSASFDALQAKLQATMSLMERRPETAEAVEAIGLAEGELEYIRFMVFGDDVPAAVAKVLEELRPHLEAVGPVSDEG